MKPEIREAYVARQKEINAMLDVLKSKINEPMPPETRINWGHVGDLVSVAGILEDAIYFLDDDK